MQINISGAGYGEKDVRWSSLLPENTRVEVGVCMGKVTGPFLVLQKKQRI